MILFLAQIHLTHAGLSYEDLKHEKPFKDVAVELQSWFKVQMQGGKAGVLVSHNTAVDIQFLITEYQRAGMRFPSNMDKGLDTLKVLRRFSSLAYRRVAVEDWPEGHLTKTGKPSMGVKPCAIYALSKREPPQTFDEVCGEHHDADADTRGVQVILFDEKQFGQRSLYHTVFKSNKRCFQPLSETWDAMEVKLKEPVFKFEPLPPGWVPCNVRSHYHPPTSRTTLTFSHSPVCVSFLIGCARGRSTLNQRRDITRWCS